MRVETFAVLLLMWTMGIIGTIISRSFYALVLAIVLGCVIIWASAGDEESVAAPVRKPKKSPEPDEGEFLHRPAPIVKRADPQTSGTVVHHHHHTLIEQRHLHLHANGQSQSMRVVEPKKICDRSSYRPKS